MTPDHPAAEVTPEVRAEWREEAGYGSVALDADDVLALLDALDATERERDEARGLAERFQRTYYGDQTAEQRLAAVREVCANPDDTQWWEVVPYMEPPNDDEVTEVQVVTVDRILAALGDAEEADHG